MSSRWTTCQVAFDNVFTQAELSEKMFVELPKLFEPKSGKDLVWKLLKRGYGLKQAPRTLFEKLIGLLEHGFEQSDFYPEEWHYLCGLCG